MVVFAIMSDFTVIMHQDELQMECTYMYYDLKEKFTNVAVSFGIQLLLGTTLILPGFHIFQSFLCHIQTF